MRKIKFLQCPMCDIGALEYNTKEGTHIYVCQMCPFVGLEFYNEDDIDNLRESITKS